MLLNFYFDEEKTPSLIQYNNFLLNCLVQADCLHLLSYIPNNSVDLVIADPPNFHEQNNFMDMKTYLSWCKEWLIGCQRILKESGSLILWGQAHERDISLARLAILIEDESLFIRKNWVTQKNSRGAAKGINYMSVKEDFLFLTKTQTYTFNTPYQTDKNHRHDLGSNGKVRKTQFKRVGNVWIDIAEANQSSFERCAISCKSQGLCDRLIQTHSNERDLVFIPFSGAGSEIISALKNRRNFIATESNAQFFNSSLERIKYLSGKTIKTIQPN